MRRPPTPRRTPFRVAAALGVLGAIALSGAARGQANCALRNPDRQIYEILPQATAYRTCEARVDEHVRPRIEALLGSPLAPTDAGTHTVYVVLAGEVPVGIVHARTETGMRGSVELVWAMDLDLTIVDFRVQRSRERHTEAVESEAFRARVIGRDLAGLRELTTRGNDEVNLAALGVAPAAASIARSVVLCALKTRLITEVAFHEPLLQARLLGGVHGAFPAAKSVHRVVSPLGPETTRALEAVAAGSERPALDADSLVLLRAGAAEGGTEGYLLFARWAGHPRRPETWWAISPAGIIEAARVVGDVDRALTRRFAALRGGTAETLRELREPAADGAPLAPEARCALEALAIVAAQRAAP